VRASLSRTGSLSVGRTRACEHGIDRTGSDVPHVNTGAMTGKRTEEQVFFLETLSLGKWRRIYPESLPRVFELLGIS